MARRAHRSTRSFAILRSQSSYLDMRIDIFASSTSKAVRIRTCKVVDGTRVHQYILGACLTSLFMFFTKYLGACSYSMLTHLDAVSSLDIDPAGLVLCSGGHDASVRLWDIASTQRTCLQEFTGHRRKGNEGVCTVQY